MATAAQSSNSAGAPAADGASFDHEPDNANSQFDAIWDESQARVATTAPENVANMGGFSGLDLVPRGGEGSQVVVPEEPTPQEVLERTHIRAWSTLTKSWIQIPIKSVRPLPTP